MSRTMRGWLFFAALTVGGAFAVDGCTGQQARTAEANTDYGLMMADCVRVAKTRDAGLACFDAVDQAWGLKDGGSQ